MLTAASVSGGLQGGHEEAALVSELAVVGKVWGNYNYPAT